MLEAIDLVRDGTAPKIPQLEGKGSYEGWCRREEAGIDWSKPAAEIYNLIRGCDPQPGAWTVLDDMEIQVFDCEREDLVSGTPGTILGAEDLLMIAAGTGSIKAKRVRPKGEQKMEARDFISMYHIKKGARFTSLAEK